LVALESFKHHIGIAEIDVLNLVKIILSDIHRQVLAPVVFYPPENNEAPDFTSAAL
jgi:hypothetical protein